MKTDTTQLPASPWLAMDRDARTAHVARLVGKPVTFALRAGIDEGLEVFGENYPVPYEQGTLLRVEPVRRNCVAQPGVRIITSLSSLMAFGAPARTLFQAHTFDELYDIQEADVAEGYIEFSHT